MISLIKEQFKDNKTEVLFLRADYTLSYGKVAKLISYLKRGGIKQIALVTSTEEKN
jgi:biopolymer transport protein TolR